MCRIAFGDTLPGTPNKLFRFCGICLYLNRACLLHILYDQGKSEKKHVQVRGFTRDVILYFTHPIIKVKASAPCLCSLLIAPRESNGSGLENKGVQPNILILTSSEHCCIKGNKGSTSLLVRFRRNQ